MKSIVVSTGTFVNRLSMSREAMRWFSAGRASRRISRKSAADERLYVFGTYGVGISFNFLAML